MSIRVRLGTKDDIPALVEVECSEERVMHGGPWMDSEALAEYWKVIERLGIIPLVAEIDGKVVGHLDVVFSDEPPLGRFLYLDVLTVHKAYRRRGVATALIKEAEGLARERNVDFLLVQPEKYEGPSGLTYRSCGFKKAFDVYQLEAHIGHPRIPSGVQLASIPQVQEPPLRTHVMMCGWDNISKKTWDFGVNPNVEMLSAFSQHMLALCALKNKTKYFFHVYQNLFQRTKGSLHLWSPIPLKPKRASRRLSSSQDRSVVVGDRDINYQDDRKIRRRIRETRFLSKI